MKLKSLAAMAAFSMLGSAAFAQAYVGLGMYDRSECQ